MFRPGQLTIDDANQLNALMRQVAALSNLNVSYPLQIQRGGGVPAISVDQSALGGGSLTVSTVDGSPSYPDTTTLRFDEADGFTISQPSANVVRVDFSGSSGTVDFPARATAVASGQVTFQRLKNVAGTWSDDSSISPATGTAYVIQFPGGTAWTPVVGDRGTVHQSGPVYLFQCEQGDASTTHRGYVNTTTQTFVGAKTFSTAPLVGSSIQSANGAFTAYSGGSTTVAFSTSSFQIGDGVFYMPITYVYTNLLLIQADPANTITDYIIKATGLSGSLQLSCPNGYAGLWSPIVYVGDTVSGYGLEVKANSPAADDLLVRWNVHGGVSPANRFKYVSSTTRWTFYGTFESDTKFRCNGSDGLTTTQTFKDGSGVTKTMTITGGIITGIA